MFVKTLHFLFRHRHQTFSAIGEVFQPQGRRQYRVVIDKDQAFNFYERKNTRNLFWFPLPDMEKEGLAKSIAEALEKENQ